MVNLESAAPASVITKTLNPGLYPGPGLYQKTLTTTKFPLYL